MCVHILLLKWIGFVSTQSQSIFYSLLTLELKIKGSRLARIYLSYCRLSSLILLIPGAILAGIIVQLIVWFVIEPIAENEIARFKIDFFILRQKI
jgi:hypothetical protein